MKPGDVRRAKVILQLAAGQSYRTISKQQIQGLDGTLFVRLDPVLPLSPGRAERHGFSSIDFIKFNLAALPFAFPPLAPFRLIKQNFLGKIDPKAG